MSHHFSMSTESKNIKIVFTGWGVKKGSNVKNWKRRWFVLLSDGNLRYFTDKLSYEEQGSVLVEQNTNIFTAPSISEGYPVQVVTKKRTLTIAFTTSEEANKWKDVLNNLKLQL